MDRDELGRRHDRITIAVSASLIVASLVYLAVIVSKVLTATT